MARKLLKPIIVKDSDSRELERVLMQLIMGAIFAPLIESISDVERKDNAKPSPLETALKSGKVQFTMGTFKGEISAAISKEIKALGGKFTRGFWRIASPSLPTNLQRAIASNQKAMKLIDTKMSQAIAGMPSMVSKMIQSLEIADLGLTGVDRVSREFKRTVGDAISLTPDIGKGGRQILKKEYFESEELPIRKKLLGELEDRTKEFLENFAQDEVEKLRVKVSDHISKGGTRKGMRKLIRNELDISEGRCKFIARQETSLLISNFKEVQYKQAGIDKYIWRTVGDNRVRDKHAELDGKTFSFDKPPDASYFNTGEPENPGHDYNCRCVAIPIIEY